MASGRSRLLFIGLAALAIASLWRAAVVEHEKRRLAEAHAKIQRAMNELEDERTHLTGQLVEARQMIDEETNELSRLALELQHAQTQLERASKELASLQREHEELLAHDQSMSSQVSALMTEKQELDAKLSSVKGLRLAIRDLTRKMWQERWAMLREHLQARRHADHDLLIAGNRGYVVRDGASTLSSSPRMHVHVLEPQAQ